MQIEVMEHFGIKKYFRDADFFETSVVKKLFRHSRKSSQKVSLSL